MTNKISTTPTVQKLENQVRQSMDKVFNEVLTTPGFDHRKEQRKDLIQRIDSNLSGLLQRVGILAAETILQTEENYKTTIVESLRVSAPNGEKVQFFIVNFDRFPQDVRTKLIRIKEAEEALVAATRAMPEPPKDVRNWDALSYLKMFEETFDAVLSELDDCLNFLNPHLFGNRLFGYAKRSPEQELQVLHSHLFAIRTEYESARNAAPVLSNAVD